MTDAEAKDSTHHEPDTDPKGRARISRLVELPELQLMLALLGLIAAMLIMGAVLPKLPTGAVLVLYVLLWLPLLLVLFMRRRMLRHAWRRAYVIDSSPWQRWLRGGPLMLIGQTMTAGLLALALLVSLARETPASTWILLLLLVPIWSIAWTPLRTALARHLSPQILAFSTAAVLRWLCAVALLTVLTAAAFWQPVPDLGEATLYEAARHFILQQRAESSFLQALLEAAAALDGAGHWLAQNWLHVLPSAMRPLAWSLVLVQQWLFIWPFLLLCEALTHVIYQHGPADDSGPRPRSPA